MKQGALGWRINSNRRVIPMFSPVEGEIVEINKKVVRSPELDGSDGFSLPGDYGDLVVQMALNRLSVVSMEKPAVGTNTLNDLLAETGKA